MSATQREQEKELVWLPKDLAKQVKDVTDASKIQTEVLKYIEDTKKDFRNDLSVFDDDVLMFRGLLIKSRESLRTAYEEHADLTYKAWEEFQEKLKSQKQFVDAAAKELRPVIDALGEIQNLMVSIHKWDLEGLLKLMQELNSASPQTREMVQFLMQNFQREK